MKGKRIALFIFVDALGWEILQAHPFFLSDIAKNRRRLKTILGYSSACDPSIISGLTPSEHGHWSCFYYSPETCPYKWVRWLGILPDFLTNNHRIRHRLSQLIAWVHGITGYFQIYNVPFKYLPYFDYAEKKWMWEPGGMIRGKSIVDLLSAKGISYYVKGPHTSDVQQWKEVEQAIDQQKIEFAYLFLGKLDALMHGWGTRDRSVGELLGEYDRLIRNLIKRAEEHYEQVDWYVFSDHGMHNVQQPVDLQKVIDRLDLVYGKDYAAMYDSTMARFWFLNDPAKQKITHALQQVPEGRWMLEKELRELGVYFPDHQYGDAIFLMHSNMLIVPSYMGAKMIAGMHGYHPDDADSYAAILSNRNLNDQNLESIKDIFRLMEKSL
jgi:hypothetical protein